MTIEEYRVKLGWSKAELARNAKIDENTLKRAIEGKPIYKAKASQIAQAISQGIGHEIQYTDLDGLQLLD